MTNTSSTKANLPENYRHVRLELAREKGHPDGDAAHGYDLVVPLTPDDHIDSGAAYTDHKDACRVRRFRPGAEDVVGKLQHGPGGRWSFHYGTDPTTNDESGYRFKDERFVLGEYISIREDNGVMHTFKVTRIETL